MSSAQPKPAWLTDELADVDGIDWEDDDQSADFDQSGSELSFTQPLGSVLVRNSDLGSPHDGPESDNSGGTFIVREEMPTVPLLPKTPGRNKKPIVKDFFSPLALEKMFEPPSPPHSATSLPPQTLRSTAAPSVRSRLSQVHVPPSEPSLMEEDEEDRPISAANVQPRDGLKVDDAQAQFTFTAPRPSPFNPAGPLPEAQSTPGPTNPSRFLNAPPTDPRLRLFQFQYDTFTRDHLSAMVDSIAVNTPSGEGPPTTRGSQLSTPSGLFPINESEASFSRLRSAKRVKLSPASDFSGEKGDGAAIIMRPNSRRDYVGESRNLMEQIRKARDFSTVSTVATSRSPGADRIDSPEDHVKEPPQRRPSFLAVPDNGSSKDPTPNGTVSSKQSGYSSLGFRQQAQNMKGSKQASHLHDDDITEASIVSADNTVPSLRSRNGDTNTLARRPSGKQRTTASPRKARHTHSARPSEDLTRDLTGDFTRMSLESSNMLAQFPSPPAETDVSSAPPPVSPPSPVKPSPGLLAPPTSGAVPAYPSSSVRAGRNEDMTRFVSSSTASGTTLTVGSAESFVKHAGPKPSTQLHITQIKPSDVGELPERVGKMVFDRVMMRWVKATAMATAGMTEAHGDAGAGLGASVASHTGAEPDPDIDRGEESEDPFRDIESLREDDSEHHTEGSEGHAEREDEDDSMAMEKSRIEDVFSEVEDAEEAELTSFSTDGPSQDLIHAGDEGEPVDSLFTDSDASASDDEREDGTGSTVPTATMDLPLERPDANPAFADEFMVEPVYGDTPPRFLVGAPRGPAGPSVVAATPLPASRSSTSITPMSVLKGNKMQTPANRRGHRRSVSFSDGKRDGPIRGIGRNIPTPDGSALGDDDSPLPSGSRAVDRSNAVLVPSARSKRIANLLDDLENADFEEDSPSKGSSSSRPPTDEMRPMQPRRPNTAPGSASGSARHASQRLFSRSADPQTPRGMSGNATFLTECSFGVAHDRLVQVITDVQPFEPHWEELTSIDLSGRNIDSTARLKEFLPKLDSLSLNSNQLSWLSGVPSTVRTLSVASNLLTGVTSFSHLLNLENLDISRNQVDSLRQLECLKHLRELRADGNHIANVDGLQKMDGLIKLSLQGNVIREIDLNDFRWTRLEMLNLSHNRLSSIGGLASVPSLVALNLDNNLLGEFEPEVAMPRLRILRLSGNRLQTLNATPFPNLRTLYADNNSLGSIVKAYRLTKLENLSVRNQSGRAGLSISIRDVRDVKRLYLSGNPLKPGFLSEPCYHLVYLELAACRLITLPADFSRMVPNVRVLNLNYNFIEDPRPLEGLTRLRKLTIIGSRIKGAKQLVRMVRGMKDIEMIDFRMNPCTLGWYLPLLVKDVPGALQPSDGDRAGDLPALEPGPIGGARPEENNRQGSSRAPQAVPGSSSRREHRQHTEADAPLSQAGRGRSSSTTVMLPDASDGEVQKPRKERGQKELVWRELDAKFRRDLPDESYVGRLAYRGLVMRACPNISMLDGIEVERKERDKAERLLRSIFGAGKAKDAGLSGMTMEVEGS
ncbi:hypothetical protein OH76DRAFT_1457148 [Lentinus brumalis]|uniref:L domain-like protein n=1 Tax=Lentinus brumalis TaxID=2498619 RepID=A0A371D1U3_9APHY|nr:hypothetical protein OH76DRAFT_1457148 [Polyporus brumalis]